MSEFTKGKWYYREDPLFYMVNDKYWLRVISPEYEYAIGFIRNEPDARLIAAAPEMYDLICTLLHDDLLHNSKRYRALSRARSIVEKVTGNKINWEYTRNASENTKGSNS